jgi:MFS family permease
MESVEPHGARPLTMFIVGNVLFATGLILHAFLYNFYLDALGLSPEALGYAASALTVGSLGTLIPAGMLADRAGPKTTLLVGVAVLVSGLASGAVVATPLAACGAAVMAGAGSAFWRVATAPLLMRLTVRERRAQSFAWNFGALAAWSGVGLAVAGTASTWIEARWGLGRLLALRVTLMAGALVSAASWLVYRRLQVDVDPAIVTDAGEPAPAYEAGERTILALIGILAVWLVGPALVSQFFNIFFVRVHHLSIQRVGFVFAAGSWCWAVVVLASGRLARRIGVRRLLFAATLAFVPAVWGLTLGGGVAFAIALYLLVGAIAPVTTPLIDQWLLDQTPRERQGAVSSWRQVAADVSAIAGGAVGGRILARGSFDSLFLVAGAVGLAGALGLSVSTRARSRL